MLISRAFGTADSDDPIHEQCAQRYNKLSEEFECYKLRAQSVLLKSRVKVSVTNLASSQLLFFTACAGSRSEEFECCVYDQWQNAQTMN